MTNVTILVHNRPLLTQQTLASFRHERDRAITVLDDASDAETQAVLAEESQKLLHVVRNEVSKGTGAARNQVIELNQEYFGRYKYLYLSDNDICATRLQWLPILIERYEQAWKYGFRIMGAYNHPYHQQADTCVPNVKEVEALALQSMIMRWSVWDQYGPFDETAPGKVCQGEDTYFAHRITAAGYKLGVVDPPLLVNTGITNSFGERIPGWELVKAQCPEGVIVE